jgi:carnitine O-acetyltransferase
LIIFGGYDVGLKKLLQEGEEVPALFSDPVFARSSKWVLSTSAVFSKHFPVYGWGEVCVLCSLSSILVN